MHGAIPPPQYVFMVWSFVKLRDSFTIGTRYVKFGAKRGDKHTYKFCVNICFINWLLQSLSDLGLP
jgi:hypothetical protein